MNRSPSGPIGSVVEAGRSASGHVSSSVSARKKTAASRMLMLGDRVRKSGNSTSNRKCLISGPDPVTLSM